jgi:hypothetical protein
MKSIFIRMLACCLAVVPFGVASGEEDPFAEASPSAEGDQGVHDESKPRIVTDEGKKTLKLLETVKISLVRIKADTRYDAYKLIKEELAKHGVTVRLKDYGNSKMTPREELALRNVPVRNLLDYLRAWAWWGWVLYPDGSITIFDNQCACTWPKDGLYCHDSQYEAGSPEAMAKEEKERAMKSDAEQAGTGQPATRSQSKSEGSDKPQPEAEGLSR